ncbi:MAG: hypothetical protein CMI18_03590 [Opitutaceae bacterium]|nr:hypothetical protein [Opitutaceae bacterium]|tara:strand:- start:1563 stop:1685 length:123 start_codon:yes stop_codon:yes gene_type:complete
MALRNSEHTQSLDLEEVHALAEKSKGVDSGGLRSEFVELI